MNKLINRKLSYNILFIFLVILLLFSSAANAIPTINTWSSNGGTTQNKNNAQDTLYLANQGDSITFSITANGATSYKWFVNKIDQNINAATFIWTVPSKKDIWEIRVEASDGTVAPKEWVISTLSISEAPDILDYFNDGKLTSRTETDPWGRPFQDWQAWSVSPTGNYEDSNYYMKSSRAVGSHSPNDIYLQNNIKYGTWKFRIYHTSNTAGGYTFFLKSDASANRNGLLYQATTDTHRYMLWEDTPNGDFTRIDEDRGYWYTKAVSWHNYTIIITEDGWFYEFVDGMLGQVWNIKDPNKPFGAVSETSPPTYYIHTPIGNERGFSLGHVGSSYLDNIEIYNNTYLFPEKVFYGQFNDYWGSPSGNIYPAVKSNAIIIRGLNTSLKQINDLINDPTKFVYDASTKKAVSYVNITVGDAYGIGELILNNESLFFNGNSNGSLLLSVYHGSRLKINNGRIDSNNNYYWKWRITNIGDMSGYPIGMLEWDPSWQQVFTGPSGAFLGSIEIYNSTINNSANFWISSPFVLKIQDSKILNLNADKHGAFTGFSSVIQTRKSHWDFDKTFVWDSNFYHVSDFSFRNVTFSISPGSTSYDIIIAQNDELFNKLNLYDINMGNANLKLLKPIKMFTGTATPGAYYYDSRTPLVNSKWGGKSIASDRAEFVPKYYLDVKVIDQNGNPVQGALVQVTNEVNANYPAENISSVQRFFDDLWCTNSPGYCWTAGTGNIHYLHKIVTYNYNDGRIRYSENAYMPKWNITATTDSTGHTPLPTIPSNSIVIPDYSQTQTGTTQFTYSITATSNGKTATITKINPDETWYRSDQKSPTQTVQCNIDSGACALVSPVPTPVPTSVPTPVPTSVPTPVPTIIYVCRQPESCDYIADGTNDQVEINQAIANTKDRDIVHIKAGTYSITNSINLNKNITLEGEYSNTILRIDATGFNGIDIYNSNYWLNNVIVQSLKVQHTLTDNTVPYKGAITTFHANNVIVRNIVAEGINGVSKGRVGILLGQGKQIFVDNVSVYNFADQGIGTEFFDNPGHPAGTDITISNCIIDGNGYTIYGIKLSPALPNTGEWNLRNTVKNCRIYNAARYGIWLYQGKNYWVGYERILNNTLYNNGIGTADAGGIGVLDQANVLIDGNTIYNNEQGIIVWPQAANANEDNNYTIKNNNIYSNYRSGIFLGMYSGLTSSRLFDISIYNNRIYKNINDGVTIDEANDVSIYSNTIHNNGNGIYDYSSGTNHLVKNNIVSNNLNYGLYGGLLKPTYNNVWNNTLGAYNGSLAGTGDISSDPIFANPVVGDFHLKSQGGRWNGITWVFDSVTSPAIDAGAPSSNFSLEPQPNGGRINIGVYGNTPEASKSGNIDTGNLMGNGKDTNGNPLSGVSVSAGGSSTQTNNTGGFFLTNVPTGTQQVTASKQGYISQTKQVTVIKDSTIIQDFILIVATSPLITSYSPNNLTPSFDEGTTNSFNVTIDQQVTNEWFLDSIQQAEISKNFTKTWLYTDTGIHNITYSGKNANGSASKTWVVTINNVGNITPTITILSPESMEYTTKVIPLSYYVDKPFVDCYIVVDSTANQTLSSCKNTSVISKEYALTSEIRAWWHFNENSGNSIQDSSGNANTGTINDGLWTTGKFGSAVQFDGLSSYIEIPDSNVLDGGSQISIEAWVKPVLGTRGSIVSKYIYSSTVNERVYEIDITNDGKVSFALSSNGTSSGTIWLTSSTAITNNAWNHIVATSNGTTMNIYINGALDNNTISAPPIIHSSSHNLQIGAWKYDPSGTTVAYFKGDIDEVRLLSKALSEDEITTDYALGAGSHNITIYAKDNFGNWNSTTRDFGINLGTFLPEDVNQDTIINQTDLDLIKNSLTTNTPCQRCDVNANGIVDIYDVTRVSVKV